MSQNDPDMRTYREYATVISAGLTLWAKWAIAQGGKILRGPEGAVLSVKKT